MRNIKNPIKNNRGQIVVEYVLLIVVAVTLAFLVAQTLTSRNVDSPGYLIQKWQAIWVAIGKDTP